MRQGRQSTWNLLAVPKNKSSIFYCLCRKGFGCAAGVGPQKPHPNRFLECAVPCQFESLWLFLKVGVLNWSVSCWFSFKDQPTGSTILRNFSLGTDCKLTARSDDPTIRPLDLPGCQSPAASMGIGLQGVDYTAWSLRHLQLRAAARWP